MMTIAASNGENRSLVARPSTVERAQSHLEPSLNPGLGGEEGGPRVFLGREDGGDDAAARLVDLGRGGALGMR
jgi:hypothetical protein